MLKKWIAIFVFLTILSFCINIYSNYVITSSYLGIHYDFKQKEIAVQQVYTSNCYCRKNETTTLNQYTDSETELEVISSLHDSSYKVLTTDLENITCSYYNTLRRGLKQRVISLSLYGTNDRYYHILSSYY